MNRREDHFVPKNHFTVLEWIQESYFHNVLKDFVFQHWHLLAGLLRDKLLHWVLHIQIWNETV